MRAPLATLILGVALVLGSRSVAAAQPQSCAPVADLHFVCGLHQPEDLVLVPATRWIIASGMEGQGAGGLFLIDTQAKSAHKLNLGQQIVERADRATYSACTTPPEAASFAAHGLSLRMQGRTRGTLYVVAHGGRESIEVFDLDASASTPMLTWRGCVPMPPMNPANSVTSLADGTIYATVLYRPGTSMEQLLAGQHTGDVYVWKPGASHFELIPGLSLAGNNGIEVSPDGATLYINATGSQDVFAYSRANPTQPLRSAHFESFAPDNVHWAADGRLIVAGMSNEDPECGGRPGSNGRPVDIRNCHRGSVVALIDPKSMAAQMVYAGKANSAFTGAATGIVIGKTLWISSFVSDRVAYLSLKPAPAKAAGQ